MKKLLSLLIISSLLLPSYPVLAETAKSSPEKIIAELEDLGSVYEKKCLPKDKSEASIKKHHEKNGLSEECWKMITRINHLEDQLQKVKAELEQKSSCENGNCKQKDGTLTSQISDLSKVNQAPMCTAERKQEIKNTCNDELTCVMAGSITSFAGYGLEKILPSSMKPKNCNLGDDNCVTQLVTGFISAAITFFKGSWELLKMAGGAIGKKVSNLWHSVVGAEDHSSTSQLALAKASEDKGVFDSLTNDFPGTMKKIWQTFVASSKEWLKHDIFCQKWEGIPHTPGAKCLRPSEGFDCISCKTMVNGMCAFSGALIAEVVPAFLTGGIFTAVKYGVSGASKVSKLFKVSDATMKTIKTSRIGKIASEADEVLKISKGVQAGGKVATSGLNLINKYLLSPLRKGLKTSYTALTNLMKGGGAKVAEMPGGKIIVFAGTALSNTMKVVLYPIDNPMTALAYRTGGRTIEKALTLGKATLPTKSVAVVSVLERKPEIESVLVDLRKAEIAGDVEKVRKLEEVVYANVEPMRKEAVKGLFMKEHQELDEVIRNLYPELKYGDLARRLPPEKILAAEKELYLEILQVKNPAVRENLEKQFQQKVSAVSTARQNVVGSSKPPYDTSEWHILPVSKFQKEAAEHLKPLAQAGKGKPYSPVSISVVKDPKGALVYAIDGGATPKDAQAIINALDNSHHVKVNIFDELAKNGNRVDLRIPVSGYGTLEIAKLEAQTVNVFLKEPIDSTSRWPSAMMKVMSPTLKAAGAEMEEEKERKRQEAKKKKE